MTWKIWLMSSHADLLNWLMNSDKFFVIAKSMQNQILGSVQQTDSD